MHPARRTADLLGREHRDTLARLARVDPVVRRTLTGGPAAETEALASGRALLADLDGEVARPFAFEERELFPRMIASGEGDLAEVLGEAHLRIRGTAGALATLIAALAREALPAQELPTATASEVRRLSLQRVEPLTAHTDKEEAAFAAPLDRLLDEDTDRELAHAQS